MKAVVAAFAFNQEKALVGAFSVITNLRLEIFEALVTGDSVSGPRRQTRKQPGPGLVLGKCLVSGEHLNNGDIWQRSGFW